jgi:hypothetical protein
VLLCVLCVFSLGQNQVQPVRPIFWHRGTVERNDNAVTVHAFNPRALEQAIEAVQLKYGWIVDYEDPPYGAYDVVDDTDPEWRKDHPNGMTVTRPAGGTLTSTFRLGTDMSLGSADEERILDQIVSDYAESSNPGRFAVKKEGPDRFSIIGMGVRGEDGSWKSVNPILDTKITLVSEQRSAAETINSIMSAITAKTGAKIGLGSAPNNMIIQTKVTVGGSDRPVRQMLAEIASATRYPLVWDMRYDADWQGYFLNLAVAGTEVNDVNGQPNLNPLCTRGDCSLGARQPH